MMNDSGALHLWLGTKCGGKSHHLKSNAVARLPRLRGTIDLSSPLKRRQYVKYDSTEQRRENLHGFCKGHFGIPLTITDVSSRFRPMCKISRSMLAKWSIASTRGVALQYQYSLSRNSLLPIKVKLCRPVQGTPHI